MQRMVGLSGEETATPWNQSVRNRLPWLFVNLLTAFLAGWVVSCSKPQSRIRGPGHLPANHRPPGRNAGTGTARSSSAAIRWRSRKRTIVPS